MKDNGLEDDGKENGKDIEKVDHQDSLASVHQAATTGVGFAGAAIGDINVGGAFDAGFFDVIFSLGRCCGSVIWHGGWERCLELAAAITSSAGRYAAVCG